MNEELPIEELPEDFYPEAQEPNYGEGDFNFDPDNRGALREELERLGVRLKNED